MVPVRRVIPAVLAGAIRHAPLCAEKVDFAWAQAVGPALQRATSVRLDSEGVLHVTANAPWAREIRRSSSLIRQRLADFLGAETVARICIDGVDS